MRGGAGGGSAERELIGSEGILMFAAAFETSIWHILGIDQSQHSHISTHKNVEN